MKLDDMLEFDSNMRKAYPEEGNISNLMADKLRAMKELLPEIKLAVTNAASIHQGLNNGASGIWGDLLTKLEEWEND